MWINPTGNAPPIKFEKSGRTPTPSAAPCSTSPDQHEIVEIFEFFWERGVEKGVFYPSPSPDFFPLSFLSFHAFIPLWIAFSLHALRRLALFRRRVASLRISPSNPPSPDRELVSCLNRNRGVGKTRHSR